MRAVRCPRAPGRERLPPGAAGRRRHRDRSGCSIPVPERAGQRRRRDGSTRRRPSTHVGSTRRREAPCAGTAVSNRFGMTEAPLRLRRALGEAPTRWPVVRISSRRGLCHAGGSRCKPLFPGLQLGPPVWLPLARREEVTAVPHVPLISEAAPGAGGARVPLVGRHRRMPVALADRTMPWWERGRVAGHADRDRAGGRGSEAAGPA